MAVGNPPHDISKLRDWLILLKQEVQGGAASETANTFYAAPDGINGEPTFRTIVSGDIPSLGITEGKIASDAVTAAKIGTGAVTESKLFSNSVTTAKISDNNVTLAKLERLALGTIPYGQGAGSNVTGLAIGASGSHLKSTGTTLAYTTSSPILFIQGSQESVGLPATAENELINDTTNHQGTLSYSDFNAIMTSNGIIRVNIGGDYSSGGAYTITLRFKFGTSLPTLTLSGTIASAINQPWDAEFLFSVRGSGVSKFFRGVGRANFYNTSTNFRVFSDTISEVSFNPTTTNVDFSCTVQFGTLSGSNNMTSEYCTIEAIEI